MNKTKVIAMASAMAVAAAGCAQRSLDQAERHMLASGETHLDTPAPAGFHDAVHRARSLAVAYARAARDLNSAQDISFFLALISAGAFSLQAANGANAAELARVGAVGASSGITSQRFQTREAIRAIYSGAQQMECIASAAEVGHDLFDLHGHDTGTNVQKLAAVALNSAINQSHLRVRSLVVQAPPDFNALVMAFPDVQVFSARMNGTMDTADDFAAYTAFAQMLNGCFPTGEAPIPVPSANPQ